MTVPPDASTAASSSLASLPRSVLAVGDLANPAGVGAALPLVRALDHWDDGALVLSATRDIAWANEAFARIVGLPRLELLNASFPALCAEHKELLLLREIDASCDLGQDTEFERLLRVDSARQVWLHVQFQVLPDEQGGIAHYVARVIDVTPRREREAELRRLSRAIDVSTQGIALVDPRRTIRLANPAFARLHAPDGCGVVDRSWFDLLAADAELPRLHDIEFAVESQGSWSGTFDVAVAGATPAEPAERRVIHQAITRLPDGGWIIAAHDSTRQAELHAALVRARDMAEAAAEAQSNFVTVVSHELRTPLNAVIGFSKLLAKRSAEVLAPRDRELVTQIHEAGKALLVIIDSILTHAKARVGRLEVERAPLDLATIAQEVVEAQRAAAKPGVSLVLDLPRGPLRVEGDMIRVEQILTQLVRNALKFTSAGQVTVRLTTSGDHAPVLIEVSDTGEGIPAHRLARIFLPFEQGETGMARRYGGTGLGLAIVKSLAELMEYEVSVESVVGVGSTFRVVVPARARVSGSSRAEGA